MDMAGDQGDVQDVNALLAGADGRDFLVRNNGDQVKIDSLAGKTIGLYFSASWCGPCHRFTPQLVEAYNELSSNGSSFEVVFVSGDEDEPAFGEYFSSMPWLAIPFSESVVRDSLNDRFEVTGIPTLVILDEHGKLLTDDAVTAIREYGSVAYPFTSEKLEQMHQEEEAAKSNQTLANLLASPSRYFVVSNTEEKVPITELEGKTVALFFTISTFGSCAEFTKALAKMYGKLKERGEIFEVVMVSLDDDESSYKQEFESLPWLAVPLKDAKIMKLVRYFELETVPTLVIIGPDGKTVNADAAELVEEHGVDAYPFTPEKLEELKQKEKEKAESQTLESLFVTDERDYVVGKGDLKVPVSELVGKHVLLYFSAEWCPPCRAFLPKLIEAYHKIKAKDSAFEVIFISSDRDQSSFDEFFAKMPWLSLPFGDERKRSLSRTFKIMGIPSLIALGPTGKTVTDATRGLIEAHGADAYPFTEERIKELEAQEDMDDGEEDEEEGEDGKEGYACDGEVCHKV